MKRQCIFLTFIVAFCQTSCGQTKSETDNDNHQLDAYTLDSSVVAIINSKGEKEVWIFKDSKPTTLTTDELQEIETILNKCVNDYNPDQQRRFKEMNDKHSPYKHNQKNFIIDLTRYKRQYVAIINSKGEKEVWINCFCRTGSQDWKKNIISVLDGGNCYFNLKVNLTTGQYYELMVNGDA
jgi:hypothetical protein